MKEIEQILNDEIDKFINQNPYKNDKTIKGLSNRFKYISENTDKVNDKINKLVNEYLQSNPKTDIEKLNNKVKIITKRFFTNNVNG